MKEACLNVPNFPLYKPSMKIASVYNVVAKWPFPIDGNRL